MTFAERIADLESKAAIMPNPQPLKRTLFIDEVDAARRLHCVHYEMCVTAAGKTHWESFHCGDCKVEEELSVEDLRKQADGLMASCANRNRVLAQDV